MWLYRAALEHSQLDEMTSGEQETNWRSVFAAGEDRFARASSSGPVYALLWVLAVARRARRDAGRKLGRSVFDNCSAVFGPITSSRLAIDAAILGLPTIRIQPRSLSRT